MKIMKIHLINNLQLFSVTSLKMLNCEEYNVIIMGDEINLNTSRYLNINLGNNVKIIYSQSFLVLSQIVSDRFKF